MHEKNENGYDYELFEETRELVDQAKSGDPDAISVLYRLYERRLKSAANRKLGNQLRSKLETVDLVQSVWKDCLSDIKDFEYRGPESFFHWLLTQVLRKVQDKARFFSAKKRDFAREKHLMTKDIRHDHEDFPFSPDPTPSQAAVADEELDRLMSLLDRLTDDQRQTLVLRLRDKMSFVEIGAKTGKSPDSVRKTYGRALRRIERIIEDESSGTARTTD